MRAGVIVELHVVIGFSLNGARQMIASSGEQFVRPSLASAESTVGRMGSAPRHRGKRTAYVGGYVVKRCTFG